MAMIAAFPSTIMEAAFGRLHNSAAGAFGAGSTVVDSIVVDGKAAIIAIQSIPNQYLITHSQGCGAYQPSLWVDGVP